MESNTNNGNEMKTFDLTNLNPSDSTTANLIALTAREEGVIRIQKNGSRLLITPRGKSGFRVFAPYIGETDLSSKKALRAHLGGFRW
tara:strand:- start:317 stop:577 length:261 start_codon:yes stop_codon:yes gene_type:complete